MAMSSTSPWGKRLPRGRVLASVLILIGTASCDQMSPVDPGSDLVSYSHVEWTGCLGWEGPGFATVYFAKGSAELDAADEEPLDANIERFGLCPQDGFHVVGMAAQEKGAKQLAAARARVVADYYIEGGAVTFPGRMEVSSYVVVGGCGGKRWWGPCDRFWATQTGGGPYN
jgi:hypothetical protein